MLVYIITEHNREDIGTVYLPNEEFMIYEIYNKNCLNFVKAVLGNNSSKVNSF